MPLRSIAWLRNAPGKAGKAAKGGKGGKEGKEGKIDKTGKTGKPDTSEEGNGVGEDGDGMYGADSGAGVVGGDMHASRMGARAAWVAWVAWVCKNPVYLRLKNYKNPLNWGFFFVYSFLISP